MTGQAVTESARPSGLILTGILLGLLVFLIVVDLLKPALVEPWLPRLPRLCLILE